MSIAGTDLVYFGSANMQDVNSGTQGGAMSTSRQIVFTDINPAGTVQYISSDSRDTNAMNCYGRDAQGVLQTEVKSLNGLTVVAGAQSFERLEKSVKSGAANGDVAIEAATVTRSCQAVAGSAQAVQLDSSASLTDNFYQNNIVRICSGTGWPGIRLISTYTGSGQVAVVDRPWITQPGSGTFLKISQGMYFPKSAGLGYEVSEVRRILYGAAAPPTGGTSLTLYEKIFVFNANVGSLALTGATVAEQSDASGLFTFALAGSLADSATVSDRTTSPGLSFDSTTKNVANSQNLTPGSQQGIWIALQLNPGQAAQKTSYTLRTQGNTT